MPKIYELFNNRNRSKCSKTDKIKYNSELEAYSELVKIKEKYDEKGYGEAVYRCRFCKGYHLTSSREWPTRTQQRRETRKRAKERKKNGGEM